MSELAFLVRVASILLGISFVASPKKPERDDARPPGRRRDQKPIPLNDLIPKSDPTGGRRTVFGSSAPATPSQKKKPPK